MPLRTFLRGKIHRATVTDADLDYVGSVSLDPNLIEAAGFAHLEQVDILNVTNGHRLTTYVLTSERGSGEVQINGAAAHLVSPGDIVILVAYAQVTDDELDDFEARVVFVDEHNRVTSITTDRVVPPRS
jgi:aspartate 1-decarboxylase